MKKEINLEEIANTSGIFRSLMDRQMQSVTLTLMQDACNKALDLAAENAETSWDKELSISHQKVYHIVDKQSILQIKDWIK